MADKNRADVERFVALVAEKQGWKLNRDPAMLADLVDGLMQNFNRYGYYLCPCRDSDGSREADRVVMCPCKISWTDIKDFGHCYCGLYLSEAFHATAKDPASIPDRGREVQD